MDKLLKIIPSFQIAGYEITPLMTLGIFGLILVICILIGVFFFRGKKNKKEKLIEQIYTHIMKKMNKIPALVESLRAVLCRNDEALASLTQLHHFYSFKKYEDFHGLLKLDARINKELESLIRTADANKYACQNGNFLLMRKILVKLVHDTNVYIGKYKNIQ